MVSCRRGDSVCRVRAGGCYRKTAAADYLLNNRMAGPTHAYGWATCGYDVRDVIRTRQYQGQRSWPKSRRQPRGQIRPGRHAIFSHLQAGHMHDDGIERGTALDHVNLACRLSIERVGCQTVNGFRGQRHQLTVPQQIGRALSSFFKALGGVRLQELSRKAQGLLHGFNMPSGRGWLRAIFPRRIPRGNRYLAVVDGNTLRHTSPITRYLGNLIYE